MSSKHTRLNFHKFESDPFEAGCDQWALSCLMTNWTVISIPDGPIDGKFFCEAAQWPPGDVMNCDFVAFGGFPGKLRQAMSFDELSFGSFSSGGSRVAS